MGRLLIGLLTVVTLGLGACAHNASVQSRPSVESALKRLTPGADKPTVQRLLGAPDWKEYYRRLDEEVWRYEQATSGGDDVLISFSPDETVKEILVVPYIAPRIFGLD